MKYMTLVTLLLVSFTAYGMKTMMFNNLDQCIERADAIVLVKCLEQDSQGVADGILYRVEFLKSIKGIVGKNEFKTMTVNQMKVGEKYLVFCFGRINDKDNTGIDNGELSPMPLPINFNLNTLSGKSVKEQIKLLFALRLKEIEDNLRKLESEKTRLQEILKEKN